MEAHREFGSDPGVVVARAEAVERVTDNLAKVVHAPDETLRLCVL